MASAHNSSDYVEQLSEWYGEDVVAVEQSYPGIFRPSNGGHANIGEVDLLVSEGGNPEKLRAYEVKESGSLNQRNILSLAERAREQCDKMEDYFEDLRQDYDFESSYIIRPVGHLRTTYEIWDSLPEVFHMDDAKEAVSEPGRIPHVEDRALEELDEEMYKIDDGLEAVFETGIVQP